MMTYLRRESAGSLLLVLVALGAFLLSFRLWGTPWAAAAFPLVAVGLVQLVVGGTILLRAPRQRRDLALRLVQEPAAYRAGELARMAKVMRDFRVYKAIELAVLAAGLLLLALLRDDPMWRAVGAGCAAQGVLMVALDLGAEARGRRYVAALERFLDPSAPVAGDVDQGE